jgi:uncharacterized membrane-anchored protein
MSKNVVWVALAVLVSAGGVARAQGKGKQGPAEAAPVDPAAQEPQAGAPPEEPALPWKVGPASIPLEHELTLALPAGFSYLEPVSSNKVLEEMGNFHNEGLLGLIAPTDESKTYFVVMQFEESGFIEDDDELDADAILDALREGQKRDNQERVQRGFKPLVLDGWAETPRYEADGHHLVWAIRLHSDDGKTINFPTRILGRRGYVMINLVVDPDDFEASKADMPQLLAATTFGAGARYEDFDPATDPVAEYGLVALITGGVAVKAVKVGLLAKLWGVIVATVLALKKVLIFVLIGLGVLIKKLWGRRRTAEAEDESAADPPAAAPPTSPST